MAWALLLLRMNNTIQISGFENSIHTRRGRADRVLCILHGTHFDTIGPRPVGWLCLEVLFVAQALSFSLPLEAGHPPLSTMGKVHGSLARAGKVKGQTPKIDKIEKKKQPRGRFVLLCVYVVSRPCTQHSVRGVRGLLAHARSQRGESVV